MKIFMKLYFSIFVLMFLFPGRVYSQNTGEIRTILTNCNVIDCTGRPVMEDMTVIISGNRISEMSKRRYRGSDQANDVRVLDLDGAYVLPGLWNNHTHLTDLHPDIHNVIGTEALLPAAIRAGRMAMDALKKGFTSLRMVAERDYVDVAWKKAFDSGVFVGPRIIPSGYHIASTHGDASVLSWPGDIQVDGPLEIRKMVRQNIRNGAKIIKIQANVLSRDEIQSAIETAHSFGVPVTAHASEKGARIAVELGIDGIEHGYGLTDETLQIMAEKGTFYDPTIVCNLSAEFIAEREHKIAELGFKEDQVMIDGRIKVAYADERSPEAAILQREILLKAVEAGVKVITGGDSNPVGEQGLLEIEQQVFSGLSEMQVLINATKNSAEMIGMLDDLGTIEEGKLADLIVVEDNPLDNISNLRKLKMVIKDGKFVNLTKNEGQKSLWELYFK